MQDIPGEKRDLLESLFPNHGCETPVIVGGQQRLCRVTRESRNAFFCRWEKPPAFNSR